jgi:type IV pilus assembly protein PilX
MRLPEQIYERGVILIITMVVLVGLMIGAVALTRSVYTTSLISGNMSFKKAALQSTDIATERAVADLPAIIAADAESHFPNGCTTAAYPDGCRYYPTMQDTDSNGAPTSIDWSTVRADEPLAGYRVRYVLERLCSGPTPVTDTVNKCLSDSPLSDGSRKSGATQPARTTGIFYRATIKVEGPRSTESVTQVILGY